MIVFPRSSWTALPPRPSTVGDSFVGLPYFNKPPVGIEFHPVGKDRLYVHRNPASELNLLLKQSTQGTGYSDIDYNYAITQNTEGIYVLRGGYTKCMNTDKIKVLMLVGENEKPTDQLKQNQANFSLPVGNPIPAAPLKLGDASVHVFDLIEFLSEKGYYRSRNDGVYGPICEHAVTELQLELDVPYLTGEYDMWVYNKLTESTREYIQLNA